MQTDLEYQDFRTHQDPDAAEDSQTVAEPTKILG